MDAFAASPRTRARALGAVVWALAALQGCGGGKDNRPTWDDTAASFTASSVASRPISRNYDGAGTYTITVSGTYTVTSVAAPDRLGVFFSMSGQGTLQGQSQPTYSLSSNGQVVTVSQTVTMNATGEGPWQMSVLCVTDGTVGTMSNLAMHTVKD